MADEILEKMRGQYEHRFRNDQKLNASEKSSRTEQIRLSLRSMQWQPVRSCQMF